MLNCIFLITKIEILFYICFFLICFFIINKNSFFLEIKSINIVKKSISLYIVKKSIFLIVDKNFASSNIVETLIFSNFFTIFNRQILVKTIIILTNFFLIYLFCLLIKY